MTEASNQTIGQLKEQASSQVKERFKFDHPVLPENQKFPEKNSFVSPAYQSPQEGIPTLSQILSYPKRDKKCRLGKTDPGQPPVRGIEVLPGMAELPFTTSRIRVGVGGKFLVLHLINDENPFVLQNLQNGEWLEVRACRIIDSDCKNIVIFD